MHDWHDGSAMTFYYETAPLPTWLGWWAHNLPAAWHHFESRAVLVLELVVPFAIFGTRRPAAAGGGAVHRISDPEHRHRELRLLLLPGAGAARLPARRQRHRSARRSARVAAGCPRLVRQALGAAVAAPRATDPDRAAARPLDQGRRARRRRRSSSSSRCCRRCSNFTEPAGACRSSSKVLEVDADVPPDQHLSPVPGDHARAHRARISDQHRRRADLDRPRPAPQGRRSRRARPTSSRPTSRASTSSSGSTAWRSSAASRRTSPCWSSGCATIPPRSARCSGAPLPEHPDAVRIAYWRYHFTTRSQRRATGAWWRREWIGATRPVPCDR